MQNTQQQASLRDLDIGYYVSHYLNLLWRWKWWILFTGPVITLLWTVYVLKFGSTKPELPATAMIGFENPEEVNAFGWAGDIDLGKIELMRSRNILASVVEKLSLRLVLKDYARKQVFDSITVDSLAALGSYSFSVDKDEKRYYSIYFTNRSQGIEKRVINHGILIDLDTVRLPGIYLKFNQNFLKDVKDVNFSIVRMRDAIDYLLAKLVLPKIDRDMRNVDHISVQLLGKDYELSALILNTLCDEFIDRNLSFKKRKTREVINVLGKQLDMANEQLNSAEMSVRSFREGNPNVGLGQDAKTAVSDLAQLQVQSLTSQNLADEAKTIRKRVTEKTGEDKDLAISEALIFLSGQQVPAAIVMQADFTQALNKRTVLANSYSKTHPQYVENEQKISATSQKVASLLDEFVQKNETNSSRSKDQMHSLGRQLQKLPAQELRLAELERQQQVSSQIHSTVLGRYNQAKITDAVEVADVFVMDYAVPPEAPSDFVNILKLIGIGLALGFLFSFGPPITFDFFDKTARTEGELKKLITLPILESIPIIEQSNVHAREKKRLKKDKVGHAPVKRFIDPNLITADYNPNFINEMFRSLRTKIMLRLDGKPKRVVLTSYNMGDGKSLIASNIAITMAQQKLKTLLIDADMRRGVLHNSFVVKKSPGLSTILAGDDEFTDERFTTLLQQTHVPNLWLLSSGVNLPNPSELLSSKRMEQLMDELGKRFDFILIDSPPLFVAADAVIAGKYCSGYVVVVRAGSTDNVALRKKLAEFPSVQNNVLGVILNQATIDAKLKEYKYSSYNY